MHDRAQFWSAVPEWSEVSLRGSGFVVVPVYDATAFLVSGDASAFLAGARIGDILGPRQVCSSDRYALRLAPDRVLVVDGTSTAPASVMAVAHDSVSNCAVTEISDGLVIFDITGGSAAELMAQGSEYPFEDTAPRPLESASMSFGGFRVIVSRRTNGWRLHVERPWAAALWRWLEARGTDS